MSQETEQQQTPVQGPYNPLFDNVHQRNYTNIQVDVPQEKLQYGIPEPQFGQQSIGTEDAYSMLGEDGGGNQGGNAAQARPFSGGGGGPQPSFSAGMTNIPDADTKEGAKNVANMIVDGYSFLVDMANMALQVSPKQLQKLQAEDEIDLSITLPYGEGQSATAAQVIDDMNNQNKDALQVSKQFKKEVIPPLTDVLAKRGVAMSKETTVVYLFAKDAAQHAIRLYQIKSTVNQLIDTLKEVHLNNKSGRYTPPPQHAPSPSFEGQTTEPRAYAAPPPQPDMNSSHFNFETNETVMASTVQPMQVPSTGKQRLMQQRQKEKIWKRNAENADAVPYKEALKQRAGKKKKTAKEYLKQSEQDIAEAIILEETPNTPSVGDSIDALD